jgi:hypothetical protein
MRTSHWVASPQNVATLSRASASCPAAGVSQAAGMGLVAQLRLCCCQHDGCALALCEQLIRSGKKATSCL